VPAALPPTVKALGAVSLLTDVSSDMIYPLLPSFLTVELKAGPAFLGLIEGVAEAAASLLKLAAGRASDALPRRKPLVVAGYSLSSLARPLVALATAPQQVLWIRLADRIGKGTRGAPRDALVAEVTPPEIRGRAFGFHRAMDNVGALLGPLAASGLLALGLELRVVFALAAVPALMSLGLLVFGVQEAPREPVRERAPDARAGAFPRSFRLYLVVLALFTLGNSSDAFLLLRAQECGVGLAAIPLVWTLHSAVKAAGSTHAGALSDRLGRRRAIALGWTVYALSYVGFALATSSLQITLLFACYGIFHAMSEGPERALVADLAGENARGAAFGAYHAVTGAMLLPASLLTGWLWQSYGSTAALLTGAALAAAAAGGLFGLVEEKITGDLFGSGPS
jgi:MFS family permease